MNIERTKISSQEMLRKFLRFYIKNTELSICIHGTPFLISKLEAIHRTFKQLSRLYNIRYQRNYMDEMFARHPKEYMAKIVYNKIMAKLVYKCRQSWDIKLG